MVQFLKVAGGIRLRPPKLSNLHHFGWSNGSRRRVGLAIILILGLGVVEPALNPPAAAACFFWQACARQRGRASNTRAGGKRTGRIVGGNNPALPYVISPRNAWIREPSLAQPYLIRWHPVDGVTRYTVRLWQWTFERDQPDFALWETTVENANQLAFPQQVFLEPGNYYSIEVVTDTGVSSDQDDGFFESGFQLLFEEDYEVLRSQLAEIAPTESIPANETLSEEAPSEEAPSEEEALFIKGLSEEAALARAGVFFLEEMYADALAILQTLAKRPTASDLVHTALGDTYSQSGLNQLAINAYEQALTLATTNNDVLSEATTRVNLADVYATIGLFDDALQQLRRARRAYVQLQEESEIVRLDRRIEIIDARLSSQDEPASSP